MAPSGLDAPQAVFATRLTDLLGVRHPIVMGGLQGLGRAPLAAAVSNAGALGMVTAGCFPTPDEFDNELRLMGQLTAAPFGVNISIGSRRSMTGFVDRACEAGVKIVFTSGNDPSELVPKLKAHDITWVHVAPSIRFARKAASLGADAIVLVGFEAGGHPGLDEVSLSVLIRLAAREFDIPVVAAGGISDGASLIAALAWGADGVLIGTRFVMTRECQLHANVKRALINADELSTVIIERSLRRSRRVLKTERAMEVQRLEDRGAGLDELLPIIGGESYLRTIGDGDLSQGVLSIGQNVALIDDLPGAADVVSNIMAEGAQVVARLNSLTTASDPDHHHDWPPS